MNPKFKQRLDSLYEQLLTWLYERHDRARAEK